MRAVLFALFTLSGCIVTRLPAPTARLADDERFLAEEAGPAPDELAALDDEFDDPASLAGWQTFSRAEGWPDRVKQIDVATTQPGHLTLVPSTSFWLYDHHAPLLFREVTGDFMVTTRVRVTGAATEVPGRKYSLAGLMARAPHPEGSSGWRPGQEHWIFITTGTGDGDVPQIETKNTVRSVSRLQLSPGKTGWVELRLVRRGTTFLLLRRFEGEPWVLARREDKPDMPATLQVGLIGYTDWNSSRGYFIFHRVRAYNRRALDGGKPDLVARFDWIRFRRPSPAPAVAPQETH
ncbi:hypothetical protein [Nannocystis radixulma]|uniref:DUF1349 domain-containing protein n=1 Tax=Nannocystis radixulma TaxID=2995305 RepID=A0ABT5AZV2_9BACT|nr:hypothetical protein [Nannocystis radixulma]MDC0667366.1 hypothetical protein [Nannocystis radixulma]